MDMMMTMMTV